MGQLLSVIKISSMSSAPPFKFFFLTNQGIPTVLDLSWKAESHGSDKNIFNVQC